MNDIGLFRSIDRLAFMVRGRTYVIQAGHYGEATHVGALVLDGISEKIGALVLLEESGETFDRITVNMSPANAYRPDLVLAPDEFCVPWMGERGAMSGTSASGLVFGLGIFEDTNQRVDSGYVKHYAAVWRFKRCDVPEHEGFEDHRVRCLDCRLALKHGYEAAREQKLARDAARRLRSAG